jgi:ABC-type transport system substrate-binding protein
MKSWTLFFSAFLSIALLACGPGKFSKEAQQAAGGPKNVFRYPIVTNPTSLDPAVVQDGDTIDLLQQVYEGLVRWDENSRVAPNLAKSWDLSSDGRTYTFHLKEGSKFFSGREVKADDFKWSIERAVRPSPKQIDLTKHPLISTTAKTYLIDIVGVKEKLDGTAKEISGLKVIDDYTLTITIDKPRPYFLGKLTYIVSYAVDKDKVPADREITKAEEMAGTGPFSVEQYLAEQLVVLTKNTAYHGGTVGIDKIERPVIKDAATRLNKYKAGEIDLVMLERQDVPALQSDPEFKSHLQFFDRPSLWYVGLNQSVVPQFKDLRVRQAIAMAIDKEKIVSQYLGGVNKVANGIVPPGVFGYRESSVALPYDPAAARKLLAEAGFPDGKGFPELEITFREQRPDIQIVAEAVASNLNENLNISVKTHTMEWRAYLDKHSANKMPFFHMRWAADYLDAENFLSVLLAGYGPENHVGYANPAYDALCREADTISDESKRLELYGKAEDLVLQDAPFVPVYFQRDAELINPRIKGLRESLFGHLPHTTVTAN